MARARARRPGTGPGRARRARRGGGPRRPRGPRGGDGHGAGGNPPFHLPAGFSGHLVVRVEASFDEVGTWGGAGVRAGNAEQAGEGDVFGGYARLGVRAGQTIVVRAGTSFTSPDAAARNLEAEIGAAGFDEVRARAESAWERALGRVYDQPWIAHADVARGATLELRMGPRPNRLWGARPGDAPPSLSAPR